MICRIHRKYVPLQNKVSMEEIWKPVKGFEKLYEVSNLAGACISSIWRWCNSNTNNWKYESTPLHNTKTD